MKLKKWVSQGVVGVLLGAILGGLGGSAQKAFALELDWSGQFWSDYQWILDYQLDGRTGGEIYDPVREAAGGYTIPAGGRSSAAWWNVFFRLHPRLIVNDNIFLKSEWWVGDPVFSALGSGVSGIPDRSRFDSSQRASSVLSIQRYWAEVVTDAGLVEVGRMPIHWGLGVFWNAGTDLYSRTLSTVEGVRWKTQLGSFKIMPAFFWKATGDNWSGSYHRENGTGSPKVGSGNAFETSLGVIYENRNDEIEAGVQAIRTVAGGPQSSLRFPYNLGDENSSMDYTTYDFFIQKYFDDWRLGFELPLSNGHLGTATYHASGFATEVDWKASQAVSLLLRSGYASGQPSGSSDRIKNYQAFYFHPNYSLGHILFRYQLRNLKGPQGTEGGESDLLSPYDQSVNNAIYAALGIPIRVGERWTLQPGVVYAHAPQVAGNKDYFFNSWTRQWVANGRHQRQGNSYGTEFDFSVKFQWDEALQCVWDHGLFFPGSFYAFSNSPKGNHLDSVYATSLRLGIVF